MAPVAPEAGPRPAREVTRRELAAAAWLYAALTLLLAWPLPLHPGGTLLWMGADTELYLWTLLWNTHALTSNPLAFLDANICHPQRFALATTENLWGNTLFAAPAIWLTGNPVLALNAVALASCVLCGVGTFLLARRLGLSPAASLLAGLVFAFSPPRFGRLGQLHLATIQWMPFALAAFHAYLDGRRPKQLRLAIALFTLQAFTSGHGAVFLLLAMGALVAWRLALGERLDPGGRVRDVGVAGLLLLLPAVLLVIPYRIVQEEAGLRRHLDETWWTDWRGPALSYIASPAHLPRYIVSRVASPAVIDQAKSFLFPGLLPIVLGAVALWRRPRCAGGSRAGPPLLAAALLLAGAGCLAVAIYVAAGHPITTTIAGYRVRARTAWRPALLGVAMVAAAWAVARAARLQIDARGVLRRLREAWQGWRAAWRMWGDAHRRDAALFYGALALVTLWLSAGPPLGPWPWLHAAPGLTFIRVPARFTLLSLLALAVLSGFGFERITAHLQRRRRLLAAALVGALMVAEFAMMPLPTVPYRLDIPEVDRWLDTRPKPFVVAELPFSAERDHTTYMLHSTAHWQPTINGYTGYRPPLHEALYPIVRGFPSNQSLEALTTLGVTYVVVHPERYRDGQWPAVQSAIEQQGDRLALVHTDGTGRVYALRQPVE